MHNNIEIDIYINLDEVAVIQRPIIVIGKPYVIEAIDQIEPNVWVRSNFLTGLPMPLGLLPDKLIVKQHTEEMKYQIHEGGDVSRVWIEENNYNIEFDRVTFAAEYVQGYKGIKLVRSKIVYSKVICLGGPVTNMGNIIGPGRDDLSLIIEPEKSLIADPFWLYNDNNIIIDDDWNYENYNNLALKIIDVKNKLESINLERGYVTSINIFDDNYPIVNELAETFITYKEWLSLNNLNKVKVYKWITQIAIIEIFTLCNKVLYNLEKLDKTGSNMDLIAGFVVLKEWAFAYLDISIKQHIVKKKAKIAGDIYTGFDTEYLPYGWNDNRLISAQLSITTGIKLSIPYLKDFVFEGVNTLTGETYQKAGPKVGSMHIIEKVIRNSIKENVKILHGKHYENMNRAVNNLIENNGIMDSIKFNNSDVIFQFKKSPIKNVLILAEKGEQLSINFDSLIYIINKYVNIECEKESVYNYFLQSQNIGSDVIKNKDYVKITPSWNSKTIKTELKTDYIFWSNNDNKIKRDNIIDKNMIDGISLKTRHYLISHYNAADLSMIEDWATVSYKNVDILKKGYATLVKPMISLNQKIYIRDTLFLSSAAASTLDAVGKAHGLKKVQIEEKWYNMMDKLLEINPELFEKYAMQDSLITLVHALFMNDFAFNLGKLKLPVTLGSLSSNYVGNKWAEDNYRGYQIDGEYPIGDAQTSHTPHGISSLGRAGEMINSFIGSFRGGRNECFSYGIDKAEKWFDYDLTSCYSTIMSMCGDLDYDGQIPLNQKDQKDQQENCSSLAIPINNIGAQKNNCLDPLGSSGLGEYTTFPADLSRVTPSPENLTEKDLTIKYEEQDGISEIIKLTPDLLSQCGSPAYDKTVNLPSNKVNFKLGYSAVRVQFNFPPSIIYPPIPVTLEGKLNIYPLQGESLITGLEYLSAVNILNQELKNIKGIQRNKYFIKIISGTFIPFNKNNDSPFYPVINELQANRRKHPKKSAMERIYKDLGNMLYGKVVCGISNKRKFDSRMMQMKAMTGNYLSNPIIGTWITGFVRSLLAELLYYVNALGGKITAVTTDGFVTNISDLENKILEYMKTNNIKKSFLLDYRDIRKKLSNNPEALEIKTSVRGLIQWTTRGQLSLEANNIVIAAMTGFQKYQFKHDELVKFVTSSLNSNNKILFLQKQLTGSLDTVKYGKKVSMINSLRKFRTVFDTKRIIITDNNSMLFTRPFFDINEAVLHRVLMNQLKQSIYSSTYHTTSYTSTNEIQETIKHFLRSCCDNFEFKTNLNFRLSIVKLLQEVLNKINYKMSDQYLLRLFKNIELNPGKVSSKLSIYVRNRQLVDILFDKIAFDPDFKYLIDIFKEYFSNFEIQRSIVKADNIVQKIDTIDRIDLIKALLANDKQDLSKIELNKMIDSILAKNSNGYAATVASHRLLAEKVDLIPDQPNPTYPPVAPSSPPPVAPPVAPSSPPKNLLESAISNLKVLPPYAHYPKEKTVIRKVKSKKFDLTNIKPDIWR